MNIVNKKEIYATCSNVSAGGKWKREENRDMEKTLHKVVGFASWPGTERPTLVYGESREEILKTVQKWNQTRSEDKQYTICNIGELNPDTGKHENYKKFDVVSGKDISNIYLTLPRMEKEEFLQVTAELKKNGAKFNPYKKQWYIAADADPSGFEQYLPMSQKAREQREYLEQLHKEIEETVYWAPDVPFYDVNFSTEVVLHNYEGKFSFDRAELESIEQNFEAYLSAIDDKVREYMENKSLATDMPDMLEGERAKFYIPVYEKTDRLVNCVGVEEVTGTLKAINNVENGICYTLEKEDGEIVQLNSRKIYTESQAKVLRKTMELGIDPASFQIMSSNRFSAAQMEEMRKGYSVGLDIDQVFSYAKLEYDATDMELYRYGLLHGLKPDKIEEIIEVNDVKSVAVMNWKEKKGELDKEIYAMRCTMAKGLKKQGFQPNLQLIKNIEKLNHLTKKENTIKDIAELYKSKPFLEHETLNRDLQNLVYKIGDELKAQKKMQDVPCK